MSRNVKDLYDLAGRTAIVTGGSRGIGKEMAATFVEVLHGRPAETLLACVESKGIELVVMTRHSDPRSGETTYKLTNINRAEPAKTLFEVPPGFTVKEMQFNAPSIAPLPRKKLANPE